MNKAKLKQIAALFNELESEDPQASTEYLMERTCNAAWFQFNMDIDSSDVADALMAEGEEMV